MNGVIAIPEGPGLEVELNREKLREYKELYKELGTDAYDQTSPRRGWMPTVPNDPWADPRKA